MRVTHNNILTRQPIASTALAGIRVLLVDDDPEVLEIMVQMLELHGGDITAVASADEALASLKTAKPHVILCDLRMPTKDGFAFAKELRKLPAHEGGTTPAIAMTGGLEDDRCIRSAGFQCALHKPANFAELTLTVAELARAHDATLNRQTAPFLAQS